MKKIKILISIFFLIFIHKVCFSKINIYVKNNEIFLKNSSIEKNIQPYLVWFDLDNNSFYSYTSNNNWLKGIKPFSDNFITIPKFSGKILKLPFQCPENHRCFIGLAYFKNNKIFTSIFPLSLEASFERLKGQNFFSLPKTKKITPLIQPTNKQVDSSKIDIEKPDIYKFDNNEKLLFFANYKSQQFEIVDLKNIKSPEIITQLDIQGKPKEIYKIDDYFIILSENNFSTLITTYYLQSKEIFLIDNKTFEGTFIESRRKDNLIYTLSRLKEGGINVYSISVDKGNINLKDKENFNGNIKFVAIFNNYLILDFPKYNQKYNELLRIISLNNPENPIGNEYKIEINGYIPSEKHVYVKDNYVFFVKSPDWKNIKNGSSFLVYRIDNSTINFVTKIDKIAPQERLYATLFTNSRAYIVTYRRKDPLWILDITNPEKPEILGKLSIPGWSEQLFFHNNLLLSIGYLDNLVSLGLFDVTNPEKPELISRLTPLKNQVKYSNSEAIKDDRAFYINWDNGLGAIPINSWYKRYSHFVQAFKIDNKKISDKGIASTSFNTKRVLWINDSYVIAFSSRELSIFKPENNKLKHITTIPLTLAADIVGEYNENIVALSTYEGIYRMYILNDNITKLKEIELNGNYQNVEFSKNKDRILFYNLNPLRYKIFTNNNFIEYEIDKDKENFKYLSRLNPFITKNKIIQPIFIPEYKYSLFKRESSFYAVQIYTLPDFHSSEIFTIPGNPAGVLENGELITYEMINDNAARINLLEVSSEEVSLLDSINLKNCPYFSSQVVVGNKKVYVKCGKNDYYHILKKDKPFSDDNDGNKIYVLNTDNDSLKIKKIYLFKKPIRIVKVNDKYNLMVLSPEMIYKYYMPIWFNLECEIYRFEDKPILITKIKDINCNTSQKIVIKENSIIIGEEEKGLKIYPLF